MSAPRLSSDESALLMEFAAQTLSGMRVLDARHAAELRRTLALFREQAKQPTVTAPGYSRAELKQLFADVVDRLELLLDNYTRNPEDEETATVRIPVRPPVASPTGGYSPLKKGPLPRNRDLKETVRVPTPKKNPYVRPAGVGEVVQAYWTGDYGKIHYSGLGRVVRYYDSKEGPTVTVVLIEPGEDRAGHREVRAGSKIVIPLPPHPDASPGNAIKRTSQNPCYTGPQVPTSQGHVHTVKCNPAFVGAKDIDPAHPMRALQYLKKLGMSEATAQEAFEMMVEAEQEKRPDPSDALEFIDEAIDAHGVGSHEVAPGVYADFVNTGDTYSPTVVFDHGYRSFVLSSWGDYVEILERLQRQEQRYQFKIHLDNMGGDHEENGTAMVWVRGDGACEWAKDDQTIEGDSWECSEDDFAYAIVMDHPGLYDSLIEQGYDVDATEYSAPEEDDEDEEYEEDE